MASTSRLPAFIITNGNDSNLGPPTRRNYSFKKKSVKQTRSSGLASGKQSKATLRRNQMLNQSGHERRTSPTIPEENENGRNNRIGGYRKKTVKRNRRKTNRK